MLAIWSLVPLPFSKFSLSIWKFLVHVLLKPWLENFEHYFASVWDECNCEVVWTFPDCSESICNCKNPSAMQETPVQSLVGRCPREGNGYPLQYSGLENPMDGMLQRVRHAWETFTFTWIFFGIAFLWDWNENGLFLVLWALLSFPNLLDVFLLSCGLSQKYSCVTSKWRCEQELRQR